MRRLHRYLLLFLIFFVVPQVAAEQINTFTADYYLQTDGSVKVREEINYQFTAPRHGIFRTIPYLKTTREGKTFQLDLLQFQVNQPFSLSREKNEIKLKIGDPDRTFTGKRTYVIQYRIKGALTYFTDHDEFYWNVNGNGWQVPILALTARVHLPKAVEEADLKTRCFTGRVGSTEQSCQAQTQETTTTFQATRPLNNLEGLTLALGFPKSLVQVLEPKPYVDFWQTLLGRTIKVILLILLTLILLFWYLLYPVWIIIKWFHHGRDPKATVGQATAWFSIPKIGKKELTPGEAGTLLDEKVDLRDFFATLIDLAGRGFLKIQERKKKEFYLLKSSGPASAQLNSYEQALLDKLFGSKPEIKVKDTQIISVFGNLSKNLYEQVVKLGLFPKNPQSIRIFYGVIMSMALGTANVLLFLVAWLFGMRMPQKTQLGADTAKMVKALKSFLVSQQRQLTFQADKQQLFEKLLPYAIAFGVEKVWAKRFKDFKLQNPDWYESAAGGRFNSVVLANSLSRSFSSMQSRMSSTTSSSGFSSGFSGGSSGGGGGGGGGGSW